MYRPLTVVRYWVQVWDYRLMPTENQINEFVGCEHNILWYGLEYDLD